MLIESEPWISSGRILPRILMAGRDVFAPRKLSPREAAMARRSQGAIAVVPILGVISHRVPQFDGVAAVDVVDTLRSAANNPRVSSIVLELDSSGGSPGGTEMIADAVRSLRHRTPIYAHANGLADGASYAIGAAVGPGRFFMTPSGEVGGLGVWSAAAEYSKADEQAGIRTTVWRATESPFKAGLLPFAPFSKAAIAEEQKRVDELFSRLLFSVARDRGVSQATVHRDYGRGGLVHASAALKAGMVDGVLPFDTFLRELQSGRNPQAEAARAQERAMRQRHALREAESTTPPKTRTVRGYAAVFNHISVCQHQTSGRPFYEVIQPGAFEWSDVVMTVGHNSCLTFARTWDGTLRLWQDDHGLRFEADIPANDIGDHVEKTIRNGFNQCSFTVGNGPRERSRFVLDSQGRNTRMYERIDLLEVCVCKTGTWVQTSAELV